MLSQTSDVHWYVLRAVFRKELTVRDGLRRAGLHCYVPMTYQVKTVKGHKVGLLVPAVSELVFVHATSEAINDYKLHAKETIYWMTRPFAERREKIIVPDKAMQDFMRITQQSEQSVSYFRPDELNLNKGDRILIHGGPFDGVEGVLLKVKGKREKQLLVSIPDIVAAAVSIRPDMVELVSKQVSKSTDPDYDAKELFRLSMQMLTAAPEKDVQEHEWNMLFSDIQRLYQQLQGIRGYLVSLEGEIALSLLMAETILHTEKESTRQRFLKALSALGEQTLLAVRMQYIGGCLLHEENLLAQARHTLDLWKSDNPSDRQRNLIAELSLYSHTDNH